MCFLVSTYTHYAGIPTVVFYSHVLKKSMLIEKIDSARSLCAKETLSLSSLNMYSPFQKPFFCETTAGG